MKGTIFRINPKRGMIAILTQNGDYSVFENTSSEEFEIGDEVSWRNDTGMGFQKITNLTSNFTTEVCFENHWISKSNLSTQLLEK